jgi:hypothetical protein
MRTYKDFVKFLGTKPVKLGHIQSIGPTLLIKITNEQLERFINAYLKAYEQNN